MTNWIWLVAIWNLEGSQQAGKDGQGKTSGGHGQQSQQFFLNENF
jgi:hypothetical protein